MNEFDDSGASSDEKAWISNNTLKLILKRIYKKKLLTYSWQSWRTVFQLPNWDLI